jgi:hypothetical protein
MCIVGAFCPLCSKNACKGTVFTHPLPGFVDTVPLEFVNGHEVTLFELSLPLDPSELSYTLWRL